MILAGHGDPVTWHGLKPDCECEDNRPYCKHCLENYTQSGKDYNDYYCSSDCWHLDNIGEVKKQIQSWFNQGKSANQIIEIMQKYWFADMTDSTVSRFKRAIINCEKGVKMLNVAKLINSTKKYVELKFKKDRLYEAKCNSESELKINHEKIQSIDLSLKILCE